MIEIMQSATGLTLTLGPFVSQADAKTPIEGVDLTTADSAVIFKHSAASASFSIDSATWTSMGSGYYSLAATSSMFDTLGPAKIAINDVSIILPYFLNVLVVHDNYWNAKYSTSPFMASASGGTIASVSNTVNCFATSIIGATIASVSNSVNFTIGTIASVSNFANWTIASVSGSIWQMASSIYGKTNYIPSATVENWTIASVSNSVWTTAIRDVGTVTGGVAGNISGFVASVSAIGVQTIASVSGSVYDQVGAIFAKLPTKYYLTGTNEIDGDLEMASVVGVFPNDLTGTLASVSSSVLVNSVAVASAVWGAASSDYGVGGTFGGILGAMGAGADPWSSTVTAYTGTNTFGLLLGGLPSTTTLASTFAAIVGKTAYIPSSTVEQWTIASVSNSVHIGITDVGTVTGNILGTLASVSSSVLIQAGQTIASVSNSVWWTAIRDVGTVTGSVASVSALGVQTIASVSGSVYGMGAATWGKTFYLPSITMGSWSISAVASVSIAGLVGSVSASVVDGFFEEVVEGVTTFRESQKYQNAFAAGKASVAVGSATASFRDIADSLDRLIMDVDEDGNRTTVTRNGA